MDVKDIWQERHFFSFRYDVIDSSKILFHAYFNM